MNYTLHQLQIFLEVVRHKSVTRAAEEMHMTQPALSIQLKNFQSQFDVPLTEIIGKRLHVTEFGLEIAEVAENVLKEADQIRYKTKAYRGMTTGKLRIASVSTGKYVIPYFLSRFLKEHPGIDLVLEVSNKNRVVQHIRDNDIDFALVSVLPEGLKIQEEMLMENKLFLVGDESQVDEDKPLIFREEGSATRMAMDKYFGSVSQRKSLQLTSNEAVKQALIAGLGYSILPLIGINNELKNGQLHIIESEGLPIVTNWRLVWLKDKKLSPVAAAYLDFVKQHKYEIINNNFKWFLQYERS